MLKYSCEKFFLKMNLFYILLFLVSTCFIVAHGEDQDPSKLSRAANCFTLDLYKNLPQDKDNIISSPFSADVVLSMLLAGAGGKTAKELNKALGYQDADLTTPSMTKAFRNVLDLLKSNEENVLNIVNSLWIQNGVQVQPDFRKSVTDDFKAEEDSADFAKNAKAATKAINNWVKEKTSGLIPKLFDDDLSPSTAMVLVNAIYNKGDWENQFSSHSTSDRAFNNHGKPETTKKVPFMSQTKTFKYKQDETLKAQVLEMDYVGGETSMVIMLPDIKSNITAFEGSLKCEDFQDGYKTTSESRVAVQMPKFKVESSFDLKKSLQKLDIKDVFELSSANLTGISPDHRLYVSIIVQKAVIKVDEKGSEAAAATGAAIKAGAVMNPQEPIDFNANRPFVYFIRHNPTNLILFVGRIKSF